jgi:L-cysteine S-thiosulfotransferase
MKKIILAACLATACLTTTSSTVFAQQTSKVDPATVDRYVQSMWAKASPEWKARVVQDETQAECSAVRNNPSPAQFDKIIAREKAALVFPADGKVLGDWKAGARVANTGTGGQFTDGPNTYMGGNCYACHQMAPSEVSYGTLGPSLTGYGKARNFSAEEAKAAYAKVYNAQSVMACSQMPRFGHNKFLSEQQIKDVTAFLFDPESPVNK